MLLCYSKWLLPESLVFWPLVKGNEDTGKEIMIAAVQIQIALSRPQAPLCFIGRWRASSEANQQARPGDKAVIPTLLYPWKSVLACTGADDATAPDTRWGYWRKSNQQKVKTIKGSCGRNGGFALLCNQLCLSFKRILQNATTTSKPMPREKLRETNRIKH